MSFDISTRRSPRGRVGSTSGCDVENVRRCIGWDASNEESRIYLLSGNSACGPGLDRRSRMRRESHVRFCEGPGVKFPRATRLVVFATPGVVVVTAFARLRARRYRTHSELPSPVPLHQHSLSERPKTTCRPSPRNAPAHRSLACSSLSLSPDIGRDSLIQPPGLPAKQRPSPWLLAAGYRRLFFGKVPGKDSTAHRAGR